MNLEELRRIRERERSTDSPQSLRKEFYEDVADYLSELRVKREQRASNTDDPFQDPAVRRISDELATAERTVEALYERRIGKIVKLASFAAADMSADQDGLTPEEQQVFDDIVQTIKSSRSSVLSQLHESTETDSVADETLHRGEKGPENNAPQTVDDEPESPADTSENSVDRLTVRITEDVGTIVGIDDRSYELGKNDIVTLPRQNAEPLVSRDVAETLQE